MKINYRPEIDGLRAIAIIAVILYHLKITIFGLPLFKGGFIGVDIFFVISGYLISSIILKELISTGSISFKYFYERRIRRIIPALLFVMLVSFFFAWICLIPINFYNFSKSILYSLSFASNFYFFYEAQSYEAISSIFIPFLHTWSLSVEEQFYIIFPIFLFFIFKYFRKYILIILLSVFFISILFADWGSIRQPLFNFYMLPSRGWELIAGSILAYLEIKLKKRKKNHILNSILSFIGILLIGYSIFFFNDNMPHPSFYTLLPVFGVCLIIWFSRKNELITKILSSKLNVGIGLISYSLYLWHYPIFAFSRITEFTQESILKKTLIVFSVLFFSILSYFLVERPARNSNNPFKKIITIIFCFVGIILILNLSSIITQGFKGRFEIANNNNYEFSKRYYLLESNKFLSEYNYNNYGLKKNILIIGNSHGEDMLKILSNTNLTEEIYFNLASPKSAENNYDFQLAHMYKILKEDRVFMNKINSNFLLHVKKQYENSELIIFATEYTQEDLEILDDLIKHLKNDNKKIIIFDNSLKSTIKTNFLLNRLDHFVYNQKRLPNFNELDKIEKEMFIDLKNKESINLRIELIAKKNQVNLIKRMFLFCDVVNERCPVFTDTLHKIYYDHSHITLEGAKFFAKKLQNNKTFIEYLKF
jgi:peptidoglycan/LPS O-acetylase OafA/YrhL